MRVKAVVAGLICGGLLVAGCGTVSGEAVPESPTASGSAFDPCEDIPDDAIRGIGLDPATEERGIVGVEQPGWRICVWDNMNEIVSVYASGFQLESIRQNPDFTEFVDIDLGDLSALMFRDVADEGRERCLVATATEGSTVMVSATSKALVPGPVREPCMLVRESAGVFLPYVKE
jgi:hypothetical protein